MIRSNEVPRKAPFIDLTESLEPLETVAVAAAVCNTVVLESVLLL